MLSTDQAFTSLAIITLVAGPASSLLFALPRAASGMAAVGRIQAFLLAPSWNDQRDAVGKLSPGQIRALDFMKPGDSKAKDVMQDSMAVFMDHATIRPSPSSEPALDDISLKIKTKTTAMILGPVGSGKTMLAKAILGELPLDNGGEIAVCSKQMAYCSQTPWLLNISIQNSI